MIPLHTESGCSAVGSALRSGRRGRPFESDHPDKGLELSFQPFVVLPLSPTPLPSGEGKSSHDILIDTPMPEAGGDVHQ